MYFRKIMQHDQVELFYEYKSKFNIKKYINATKTLTEQRRKPFGHLSRWREKAFDTIINLFILHTFSKPGCHVTSAPLI